MFINRLSTNPEFTHFPEFMEKKSAIRGIIQTSIYPFVLLHITKEICYKRNYSNFNIATCLITHYKRNLL